MNLQQKLYQMFVLGIDEQNTYNVLSKGLGGVIFFTKDIVSIDEFSNLVKKVLQKSKIKPFLSIDQEGGRVERTENIWNGKKYLSAKFAFEKGEDFLCKQTEEIAQELKNYGLNLNFAPCIDVNTNPDNPIIGERAFSANADEVIKCGKLVSSIYAKNNIVPCLKHFPGHGDAKSDSHITLPKIDLSLDEMEQNHIQAFKEIIKDNENIDMVMVAHLHCPCFEEDEIPTSLSKNSIDYLRNNIGFKGVVVSDDMVMQALDKFGKVEACEMAIRAGVNMFIYRNCDNETLKIIEKIYQKAQQDISLAELIEKSYQKIHQLKLKYKII